MKKNSLYNTSKTNKGFSLVELIVVIAIMVVLVAAIAPSFTQYIEKARIATCTQNRDTLLRELIVVNTDNSNSFSNGDVTNAGPFSEGNITAKQLKDAGITMDLEDICPDHGVITVKMEDGTFKVYCSKHESSVSFGNSTNMAALITALDGQSTGTLDSGALSVSSSNSTAITNALLKNGVDLTALGATSWKYVNNGKLFYWSTQDISTLEVGTTIPVIRYNGESGNYTVWNAQISIGSTQTGTTKPNAYNIIDSNKCTKISGQDNTEQTYENALKLYEKTLKNSSIN